MIRNQKLIVTGLCLIVANSALADGSLNALEDVVYTIIIGTFIILLFLAIFISLVLNFLVFKNNKHFKGTTVGAFVISAIPTIFHEVVDYHMSILIIVFICSLLGGLLGYFLTTKLRKTSS